MIRGRFGDTTGSPYLEARLSIPSMGCDGHVSFLFDTGADSTTLMPLDGTRLQIDYERFNFDVSMGGIGGIVKCVVVDATILFPTEEVFYGYGIRLNICERNEELMGLPSLLGRDVINKWQVTYDQPNSICLAHDVNFDSDENHVECE